MAHNGRPGLGKKEEEEEEEEEAFSNFLSTGGRAPEEEEARIGRWTSRARVAKWISPLLRRF